MRFSDYLDKQVIHNSEHAARKDISHLIKRWDSVFNPAKPVLDRLQAEALAVNCKQEAISIESDPHLYSLITEVASKHLHGDTGILDGKPELTLSQAITDEILSLVSMHLRSL